MAARAKKARKGGRRPSVFIPLRVAAIRFWGELYRVGIKNKRLNDRLSGLFYSCGEMWGNDPQRRTIADTIDILATTLWHHIDVFGEPADGVEREYVPPSIQTFTRIRDGAATVTAITSRHVFYRNLVVRNVDVGRAIESHIGELRALSLSNWAVGAEADGPVMTLNRWGYGRHHPRAEDQHPPFPSSE